MQTINQKNAEAQKIQAKLLWKKYSSAIIFLGIIIISCIFTINKLASSEIIKILGSPENRAKSVSVFSLDDAVLTGVLCSFVIAFIICFSLYIKQTYEIKKFKSENALANFIRDYGEIEKIESFLSETINLRNSLIAISLFMEIASQSNQSQNPQDNNNEYNNKLQLIQNKIFELLNHISDIIPQVDVSESEDYKQLLSILETVHTLLLTYMAQDEKKIDYYSSSYLSYIDQMSFSHIYKLYDEKDDKKDHVKILNEVYRYIKKGNYTLSKKSTNEQKIKNKAFFKTKKKDDLYHVFEAISQSMLLEKNRTSENEGINGTEVVKEHLADVNYSLKIQQSADTHHSLIESCLYLPSAQPYSNNLIASTLKDQIKAFTGKISENAEYITGKFNSAMSNRVSDIVTAIFNRDENKIAIRDLYKDIQNRKALYLDIKNSKSSDATQTIEDNTKYLTIHLIDKLLENEIKLVKIHDSKLKLSEKSVIFRILKDKLYTHVETELENMAREEEQIASGSQITSAHIEAHSNQQQEPSTSFQPSDDNGAVKGISSTTSPKRI